MKRAELILEFDNKTIRHLGISLYSSLPPVIAELVANSYDANSERVKIFINDSPEKSIVIIDNGDGMTYEDLRKKYLEIGRDRREEQLELNFGRKPIGKKGIGKLAGFGVANDMTIDTISGNVRNTICLDYKEILNTSSGRYSPALINDNEPYTEDNGTKIKLENLKRITPFSSGYIEFLANDLAKRFTVFDDNFIVELIYNNEIEKAIQVTNEMKFENLDVEFEWEMPIKYFNDDYEFKDKVVGKIIATNGPVSKNLKGIFLLSRGKLVNQKEFFDADNQDYAFTHLTGWLNIDFIEDFKEDVISTNRESLNWELEETIRLREYLTRVVVFIKDSWREKRKQEKIRVIKDSTGIDVNGWIDSIHSSHDRALARKIVNTILTSSNIEASKAGELVAYIKNSFEFESFKHYAEEMSKFDSIEPVQLIKLLDEWHVIEAREIYNLSKVRIEAIKTLEKHINDNALEVSILERFFEKFPWILDPRIMEFKTEQRYSQMLKDNFVEDDSINDVDRRLDFLCLNHLNQFFIIELKRPKSTIGKKFLNQALDYSAFIESRISNQYRAKVICYIIGGKRAEDSVSISLAESLRDSGKVFFKPYELVLGEAKRYHQEIIQRFDDLKNKI